MQEAHRSASQTIDSFICCSLTMSAMASRPPGFSTRAASAKTASLSGARLMTPFEITQSQLPVLDGQSLDPPLTELDLGDVDFLGESLGPSRAARP